MQQTLKLKSFCSSSVYQQPVAEDPVWRGMAAAIPWFFDKYPRSLTVLSPAAMRAPTRTFWAEKEGAGRKKNSIGPCEPLCVLNWTDGWALFCLMGWLRPSIFPHRVPHDAATQHESLRRHPKKNSTRGIANRRRNNKKQRGCAGLWASGGVQRRRHIWRVCDGSKLCLFPRLARAQAAESSADLCHELTAAAASDWTSENWRGIMDRNGKMQGLIRKVHKVQFE